MHVNTVHAGTFMRHLLKLPRVGQAMEQCSQQIENLTARLTVRPVQSGYSCNGDATQGT